MIYLANDHNGVEKMKFVADWLTKHGYEFKWVGATTYEKSSGTELVIDVISGGRGYYVTKGTLTEFTWALDEIGELNFYSLSGERLTVNRGNSYLAFYKASDAVNVKIG